MRHGQRWLRGRRTKRSRCCLAGLAGIAVLALSAPAANALVVHLSNGRFAGVFLRPGLSTAAYVRQTGARPVTSASRASNAAVDPNGLFYNGGQVLHTTSPYLVFWDPSSDISAASRRVMTQYYTDAALDNSDPTDVYAYRILSQYTDSGGAAAQGQTFSSGAQVINDSHAYPTIDTSTCPAPSGAIAACITDAQIQTELTSLINTDHLPTGIAGNAPIYFVVTPENVNVCVNGGGGCSDSEFCAYHSDYTGPGSSTVIYASIPFTLGFGCQSAGLSATQDPNGDVADVITDNMSHENAEAITDPLGTAWLTTNGYEVADQCEEEGPNNPNDENSSPDGPSSMDAYLPTLGGSESAGTLYDQLINGDHYFTQTLWSNSSDNCEETSPTASFIAPAPILPGVSASFDPSASSTTNGYTSATWNWGDGSPNTVVAGAPTVASHTYASGGTYTVTLTLVDGTGHVGQTSQTVAVESPPTAAFSTNATVTEVGTPVAFNGTASTDPNPGQSIASYGWNFGDGSAAGAGAAPSHTYASPGTYTVALTVTGSEGLTATTTHTVTVVLAPFAAPSFSPAHPVAGAAVSFNASNPSGGISAYAWNFGDGATGSGVTPKHTYAKPGTYTVTLTVTDAAGFTSSKSLTVVVLSPGKIKRWSVQLVKGTYNLVVTVSRAGTVRVGSAKVRLNVAGKATLKLSPLLSRAEQQRLATHQTVSQMLTIIYSPTAGPQIRKRITVKL